MAIGVAPGASEEQTRLPFSGDIGSVVREVVGGIVGADAYYTNVLKRRTYGGKKPTAKEISYCGNLHLTEEVRAFKPPIIVTFGQIPASFIYGQDVQMSMMHGLPVRVADRFGYDFSLLAMYDPGYVARRGGLMSETGQEWLHDLQELRKLVDGL